MRTYRCSFSGKGGKAQPELYGQCPEAMTVPKLCMYCGIYLCEPHAGRHICDRMREHGMARGTGHLGIREQKFVALNRKPAWRSW